MLLPVEDLDIKMIGLSIASQQFGHAMLIVLTIPQFQDRLSFRQGQPEDRAAGFRWAPLGPAHQPWQPHPCQAGGGRLVQKTAGIRMALQKTG